MPKLKKHHYLHLSRIFVLLAGAVFFLNQKGITMAAGELNSSNITGALYDCATNATQCHLDYKGITSIATDTFINHSNLINLYLAGNNISSIEEGDFNGLNSVELIDLQQNNIYDIGLGSFSGLSQLKTLWFTQNYISSIDPGDYSNIPNLINLDLTENYISSIAQGDLTGMSSLEELYLTTNRIISIDSSAFDDLPNLTSLDIQGNCIDTGTLSQSIIDISYGIELQYVCPKIVYSTLTNTSGPVTGTLILTGGNPNNRVQANIENSNLSSYTHTWTSNGSHGFDIQSINDNDVSNLLHSKNIGYVNYAIITGMVDWIFLSPSGLKSYFGEYENDNRGSRVDVVLNQFDFGNAWKELVNVDTVYDLIMNVKNTLGRTTNTEDRIPLPGGFRYPIGDGVASGSTQSLQFKVKYFNK